MVKMDAESRQSSLPFDKSEGVEGPAQGPAPPFAVSLLGLSSLKGLGRVGVKALVKTFGDDLGKVWDSDHGHLRQILDEAHVPLADEVSARIVQTAADSVEQGKARAQTLGRKRVSVVPPSEIPKRLRSMPDPPCWLFVQGKGEALYHRPAVAVVGTREASERGRRAARLVAELLAAYSITLVSGLAEGIDDEAHKASLEEGARNLAFLGHGIDHVFPASTAATRQQIVRRGGAVVSEYLPDERYKKSYFVERNRLQAALADIVIPVEGKPSGGTAHTFRFARTYKRDILGIRWEGVDGLVEEIEKHGYPSYDISDLSDRKKLDKVFRDLAEEWDQDTYALSLATRRLREEFQSRDVRTEDVDRFLQDLDDIVGETTDA